MNKTALVVSNCEQIFILGTIITLVAIKIPEINYNFNIFTGTSG